MLRFRQNETYLMMDTCAGASIFPRDFDENATDDSTVAPVTLSTATDDPVHGGMRERNHVLVGEMVASFRTDRLKQMSVFPS